jgi:DNA helicase-2/ATP-dependent DNA helicase PcrA
VSAPLAPPLRPGQDAQARLDALLGLLEVVREQFPRTPVPWFGHMRLHTGRRELDVLLGTGSHTAAGLSMIEWQTAPLAEVFFSFEEGEAYEVDLGDRAVTGRVIHKSAAAFEGGELSWVDFGGVRWARDPEQGWIGTPLPPGAGPAIPLRPVATRGPFRSPLEVQLDAVQRRAVDLPPGQSVLLLGEAGFGKTTVALHRLVTLHARGGRRFKGGVMVPTEGLRRLTEGMLARRGVVDVDVWTYPEWASRVARRAFRQLPRRESENTHSGVLRLKRHPALRPVLEAFVRKRPRPSKMEHASTRSETLATRADLEHLFGDSAWLDQVVEGAGGALARALIAETQRQTKIQFSDTTEGEAARSGVRADALETADGRRIDEGTPMEDANSVDAEDYAVLFELERLRAKARGEAPAHLGSYDCLVLDEAQEFAPIELALIRRALKPGGTVVVAGDAAQQVDPTSFFGGWPEVMAELGAPRAEKVVLEVNYRCPPDVTELARAIIDPSRPVPAGAQLPSVVFARSPHLFHQARWLLEALRRLDVEDPSASVTVVTRSPESARVYARALRHGSAARLALNGEFEFRPGLTVTCIPEVKGLEFDYVLLPDAHPSAYPALDEARRALYVGVTRASHRLVLGTTSAFSPLLRTASS